MSDYGETIIHDANGNLIEIENGRLKVEAPEPTAPPATTPVSEKYIGEHNGTFYVEFEIPSGKKLTVQRLYGGASVSREGSIVELKDRGLDDNQWETIGIPLFINGNSDFIDVNETIEASAGVSRWIEMLIINDKNRYSAGRFVGYLEDI